jgi:beta-aspartyl-peptidase (threonine type)
MYREIVLVILCLFCFGLTCEAEQPPERREWAIAIHGGAGSSPENFTRQKNQIRYDGIKAALQIGADALKAGDAGLDVVEKVLRNLEDNPTFNAGKGAVFNAVGKHELDASIMNGADLSCGAVAGVSIVKNPISLARLVMTETKHVLLSSDGADTFARQQGVKLVENSYFDTPAKRRSYERKKSASASTPDYFGTVGCVVLDRKGNLAAGTSTGGLTGKKYGRIGDSPIIGAGTYADNATCAVSCTGVGEQFIRHAVAYDISARMKYGNETVDQAVKNVLTKTLQPGWGGVIAIDRYGNTTLEFNTKGMARGAADSTGKFRVDWNIERSRPDEAR